MKLPIIGGFMNSDVQYSNSLCSQEKKRAGKEETVTKIEKSAQQDDFLSIQFAILETLKSFREEWVNVKNLDNW